MTVKKILELYYEGLSTDPKPTGVVGGTTFRETDTRALYITYDGDNWVVADQRVRLVGESGDFLALDEQLDDLLTNVAVLEHHGHSRSRVYPQDVGAVATLIAGTPADTFGDWAQIIPIDTVDFLYEVVGLVLETVNAATTYLIQLGYSILTGSDPTTVQTLGERRVLLPTPAGKATELLQFYSQDCPADAKLWGRIKSASGAADQLGVSVVLTRHVEVTNPIPVLATWPWAS